MSFHRTDIEDAGVMTGKTKKELTGRDKAPNSYTLGTPGATGVQSPQFPANPNKLAEKPESPKMKNKKTASEKKKPQKNIKKGA